MSAPITLEIKSGVEFVQIGRWALCFHCEGIYSWYDGHYCGAPWQHPASDMPPEFVERAKAATRSTNTPNASAGDPQEVSTPR